MKNNGKFPLEHLLKSYEKIKEATLKNRYFKHKDILPLINSLFYKSNVKIHLLGKSLENREIYGINIGKGNIKIMIWSQMHGNEPTGTAAIFDMLNFLTTIDASFKRFNKIILERIKLLIIPMLNPDGTEIYQRENIQGIDINRDAIALQAFESKILRKQMYDFKPHFAFNLHDQRRIFNISGTHLPASISFLAPSIDVQKTITEGRKQTMGVIASMNEVLQQIMPNSVGRYTDDFYPTATGDNFQKMGCNTILIECGGMKGDIERQKVRKLNFIAILQGINFIINAKDHTFGYEKYFEIPNNAERMIDVIIRNASINNSSSIVDIGIMLNEQWCSLSKTLVNDAKIEFIGDLSDYYGYEEYDAKKYLFCSDNRETLQSKQDATFKIGNLLEVINGKVYKIN